MDKHKNADRHKIYPGFREFYDKGLLKATYKDIALKKEYQCSKCGKKIKIDIDASWSIDVKSYKKLLVDDP